MTIERLKWAAIVSFIVSLGGLLIGGMFANREAPPYPGKVMGPDGATLFTKSDILAGQDVYQRYGLMDHGSVWGHGSQRGMEFSAVTSRGLDYVRDRLRAYRQAGGGAIIVPALAGRCGLEAAVAPLLREIETMAETLAPYVDGFVWVPALAGCSGIWSPHHFRSAAQSMSAAATGRLLLVEMPAFEPVDTNSWLNLVDAFVDGGGDGLVAVGGREVSREHLLDLSVGPSTRPSNAVPVSRTTGKPRSRSHGTLFPRCSAVPLAAIAPHTAGRLTVVTVVCCVRQQQFGRNGVPLGMPNNP
ncbi:MAG: hypothetical protein ACYC3X_22125 [Pirellulaceae bacterium]